jgi:hypothetical protein
MVAAETTRRDPQQLRRAAGRSPIRRRGCWRALLPVATHALGYLCDHRLDDIGVGHEALALLLREICRASMGFVAVRDFGLPNHRNGSTPVL